MKTKTDRPIFFSDAELFELSIAVHNHTRKGRKMKHIRAQGHAAAKCQLEIINRFAVKRDSDPKAAAQLTGQW